MRISSKAGRTDRETNISRLDYESWGNDELADMALI